MYYLYIDESGKPSNPVDENGIMKSRHDPVFCLGGIIVNDEQKTFLENEHKRLLNDYFTGKDIPLESDFKLHYNELRMNYTPYSIIGKKSSQQLEKEIFSILKKSDARLLSFTIDLIGHYRNYGKHPVNPLAFGLIILFERLSHFMRTQNVDSVRVIYERFDKGLRELVFEEHKFLQGTKFRTSLNLKNIIKYINEGDPVKEPVLQFTDFWAYLPFLKEKGHLVINSYSTQYYNFDTNSNSGNVSIRY